MFVSDILFETTASLTANKIRSGLTVLGIVIGIGSVIAMVAIGSGAQVSIERNIQAIGSNLLIIRPGAQGGPGQSVSQGQGTAQTLSFADLEAIRTIPTIAAAVPVVSRNFQVVASGKNTRTSITGTVSEYATVRNTSLSEGVFLTNDHEKRVAKVAVLGPDVRDELFGVDGESLGRKIRIGGTDFTVIGVTVSKGGSGFGNEDDVIYVPLSTARQYLTGSDTLSLINVKVQSADVMDAAEENIRSVLLAAHRIGNPDEADFRILNQGDIVETASSITSTFTLLLGAVASISLVVGGIGIMNMMLTTVTERTREIGLRKAIGAKRGDISTQFLIEAFTLTVVGGFFGIVVGWIIATIFESLAGIETSLSLSSIALAFGVSVAIGIVFGWYPARRAAKLNPIEALRYE